MRKEAVLVIFLSGIMLLSACEKIDVSKLSDKDLERISKELIVCNAPYIRFASSCCLDKNKSKDNSSKKKCTKGLKEYTIRFLIGFLTGSVVLLLGKALSYYGERDYQNFLIWVLFLFISVTILFLIWYWVTKIIPEDNK